MPVSLYAFVPQLGCTVRFLSGLIYNVNSQNLRPMQTSAYKRRPNADQVQTSRFTGCGCHEAKTRQSGGRRRIRDGWVSQWCCAR